MSARWSETDLAEYKSRRGAQFVQSGERGTSGYVLTISSAPGYRLIVVPGPPVPKPRQTQSDKWKKRPAVVRYREWADRARALAGEMPTKPGQMDVKFFLPIPASWSEKKRAAHRGLPHQVKPDKDNLEKAVCDALLKNDQCIWKGRQEKRWDDGGGPRVEITIY